MSELAKNAISKGSIDSEVFSEKVFKLHLRHRVLGLGATFMLVLLPDHWLAEKRGGKKVLVGPVGPSGVEIVFALLAKAIAVGVWILIIKFGEPSLEGPLLGCGVCLSLAMLLAFNK